MTEHSQVISKLETNRALYSFVQIKINLKTNFITLYRQDFLLFLLAARFCIKMFLLTYNVSVDVFLVRFYIYILTES